MMLQFEESKELDTLVFQTFKNSCSSFKFNFIEALKKQTVNLNSIIARLKFKGLDENTYDS